jgi:hypothetical protein
MVPIGVLPPKSKIEEIGLETIIEIGVMEFGKEGTMRSKILIHF